jgi:hypothetical protein
MFSLRNKCSPLRPPVFALAFFFLLAVSCEKPAGPGGNAGIKGQVVERTYDRGFRVLQYEIPAADRDVFIRYGGSRAVSDDRKTSEEGVFEFNYLSKGDYTVFVYSEDSSGTSESGMIALEREINLSSNTQSVDLGVIPVLGTLEVDEGQATITGKVHRVNYARDFSYIKDTVVAPDVDVYLVYEDDPYYTERIRTLYDGNFAFPGLIKGEYAVFVYADDVTGGSVQVPVRVTVNVDELAGMFDTGILYPAVED